jgi:signal transduction histidine kinase
VRARDRSLHALHLVAAQLEPPDDEPAEFYGRLSAAVAELVSARRAGFFLLEKETLNLQPNAFGIDPLVAAQLRDIPCRPDGELAADRVVFKGDVFRGTVPGAGEARASYAAWLDLLGADVVIAVPWRAGEIRLGLVAAFDSAVGDFSTDDVWVLQVAATAAALVWQQRKVTGKLLTEKSDESDRLRDVAERMGELEELKAHILNLAAHELRGPMAVIRGYLSMLSDGSIDEGGLRRILPILLGKAAQMDGLINQMLEVARLEEGRLDIRRETVDLGAAVRQAVDVAALLAPPGLSVFLENSPAPLHVLGDLPRITTIVGNLVDNAIKYSPSGGEVKVQARARGRLVEIRVSDQGIGISELDQRNLFRKFFRVDASQRGGIRGVGLGLFLVRGFVAAMGGRIWVESELGKGSTFVVELPATEQEPTVTAKAERVA